ncbi:hypothetical protein [Halorientalis marina]|uniref:hypothetical protein n=1 Tax=Halorientalis marina TaxID=2931976 RepID=UPI001FF28637|nr:hypothetical protein [Halorientalis marina]
MSPDESNPTKADQYDHPDGTLEVVFAVEDGKVLTIREYDSVSQFERNTSEATYAGSHHGVLNIPDLESFREDE